jgi:hypothetical protein
MLVKFRKETQKIPLATINLEEKRMKLQVGIPGSLLG